MKIITFTTVSLHQGVDWRKQLLSIYGLPLDLGRPRVWDRTPSLLLLSSPITIFVHTRPKPLGFSSPFFGFFDRKVVLYPKLGARFRRCCHTHFPSYPLDTLFPLRQMQRWTEQTQRDLRFIPFFGPTFDLDSKEKKQLNLDGVSVITRQQEKKKGRRRLMLGRRTPFSHSWAEEVH